MTSRLSAAPSNDLDTIDDTAEPCAVAPAASLLKTFIVTIAMVDGGRVAFEVKAASAQQALGQAQKIADGKKVIQVGDTATKISRQHVVRMMAAPKFGDPKDRKTAEAGAANAGKLGKAAF